MKKYDTTFIIDGSLGVDEREAIIEKFNNSLEKLGGKVDQIVRWGQRNLAYEINKKSQGFYVIFYHTSEPSILKTFEHELGLNENILRYMSVVFDGIHPVYIREQGIKREVPSYSPNETVVAEISEDMEKEAEADEVPEDTLTGEEEKTDDILDEHLYDEDNNTASDTEITDSEDESVDIKDESTDTEDESADTEDESADTEGESVDAEEKPADNEDESEDNIEDKEDM